MLSLDAIFCPECEALWQTPADVGRTTFEDYGTFMIEHGRSTPDRPSEIEIVEMFTSDGEIVSEPVRAEVEAFLALGPLPSSRDSSREQGSETEPGLMEGREE
jgi:hypothetical protein